MPRNKKKPEPPVKHKPFAADAPLYYKNGRLFSDDKGLIGIDGHENKIIVQKNLIKIFIKKTGYTNSTSHKLFTIDNKNKRLICERDYSLHFNKEINGYGFNLLVLRKAKVSDYILLKEVRYDKAYYYEIPIDDIINHGIKHNYRKGDIREVQMFMTLEQLEGKYKISREEANL